MDAAVLVLHNMEPPTSPNPLKCPPPGPLQPLSPERVNQQRLLQSPPFNGYLVENDPPRSRDSMTSDVQSKVAFLNSLAGVASGSVPTSPTRPVRNNNNSNNALQRAVMGYEEAQASLATLTAELEREREESATRKKRERMLAQRVEQLLEELQTEKVKRSRDQEAYAKEIKRCRKEAYRAELAVVEARQDLQEARSELKKSQTEIQHEKTEKEKSRQESFERAYALAGMVGEMEQLKDQLKVIEKERDAALSEVKTSNMGTDAKHDGDENIASRRTTEEQQGQQTLSPQAAHGESQPESTTYPPPATGFEALRFRLNYYDKQMEGAQITPQEEIQFLKQELRYARMRHAEDADMIHFMNMQCQFKACPCRQAEEKGERFIHDHAYEAFMQDQRASKKRRISNEVAHVKSNQQQIGQLHQSSVTTSEGIPEQIEAEPCRLPPEPTPEHLSRPTDEPLLLDEAIDVPLPEPQPMELDSKDATPEPTAQLEDITQVLVEPGTASKPFFFSTSTMSNPGITIQTPSLRHTETAPSALEQDLFDLSPPKQAPLRRPSTAMGILTIDSPIRLVPDSTHSTMTSYHEDDMYTTSTYDYNHTITTTTKIALKGSPQRDSLHRRAQSRPNIRSHSPLVPPAPEPHLIFSKESSASPASATVFPVTPAHKHSRSMHNLAQHAQSQPRPHRSPSQTVGRTTTTTRVPLRGSAFADGGEEKAHVHVYEHAHTEVLNIDVNPRMDPLSSEATRTEFQTSSGSILGNAPGTPISREAALAQIRARRDRARSLNLKLSTDSNKLNGAGGKTSPTKPKVLGVGGVGAGLFARDKENVRREISQASAPGRMAF
ncbi:hypothetical protein LTR10_023557 [Elasticomyces elasticus]|uniref:Uncharacterized protein n=1 Tax=Exophiala sideris TaxID=1016849 RepID=A0ABR0J637_9EURO|nr:hypothetical protein LTR10_023557 [Elasticomyces elasticus]KAK5028747.1 hypothetical protein LTS07_006126 [Exophiala sideris]KAK5035615.1 hypothetical protein LTR13_005744 [Exophiala sideris]KAK5057251.1 hypothetical protein LTR69_007290 [Exophiala sideris]KAK5181776.1 hypothetical protein LTR44_005976 [Eurotiomycetes sp. CCFEE 6388]